MFSLRKDILVKIWKFNKKKKGRNKSVVNGKKHRGLAKNNEVLQKGTHV
jgi:hypothetical protein